MEKKQIKMDQEGFKKYLKEIEKLEEELSKVRMYKGQTAIFQGDNWHDNPELYQTEANERSLMQTIARMKDDISRIQIIERNLKSNKVDIGDVVRLLTIFAPDDVEEMIVKLVGANPDFNSEIRELSINSPLGAAIYGKEVDEELSYSVNGNVFQVKIQEKITLEKQQGNQGPVKKLGK